MTQKEIEERYEKEKKLVEKWQRKIDRLFPENNFFKDYQEDIQKKEFESFRKMLYGK